MSTFKVNADDRLYSVMIRMKSHLRTCKECRQSLIVRDPSMMCAYAMDTMLQMMWRFDKVIPLRQLARRIGGQVVYPCPDLSAHGKAYGYTAEPVIVTHIQDSLL